ncbi:feruloyl esterase B precursor [Didymella exigua CBS 183.55]|uniref:Carboxylic ester hydrolase n=1 Tax=Didymella exigua CBS 183.55 TaxID=1150837 RepID=A0A6A5RCW0_9PLEO|nr:feruloyl esterase B precursor [Didymella exigua CBS 183.55]KAF1925130.1 feruloyl esterase B precursor [Didymella exigua CBS 183.55]
MHSIRRSDLAVLSVTATPQHNFTSNRGGPLQPALSGLSFCQVRTNISHRGTNDKVLIEAWLPISHDDWNGRFQATGGAGFETGMFGSHLGQAVQDGWAAVSTDGGSGSDNLRRIRDGSWILKNTTDGTLDWNLLHNFASRSLVDQINIGKVITELYFGRAPHHSYWNGCSTGGRQGYMIAQKHPHLLDGILANAPALNFINLVTGEFWSQLVMKQQETFMSNCEFEYFRQRAIEQCDMLDGVRDGILEDPEACKFDPFAAVGEEIECDGKHVDITLGMATVVEHILKGPKQVTWGPIFHGISPGIRFEDLANIDIAGDGIRSQKPFGICESWMKNVVLRDPSARLDHLDITSYFGHWAQANYELGGLLNTADPDLTLLKASGAKLLTWHGIDDTIIPYQNTIDYRKRVEGVMGGAHEVDQFYRLFLAPGVEHCGGGIGPAPSSALSMLVDWVEKGEAPEVLGAETKDVRGEAVTRDLCAYPGKLKYMGLGDAKRASSWTCVGGTENPKTVLQNQASERIGNLLGRLTGRFEGLGLGLNIG